MTTAGGVPTRGPHSGANVGAASHHSDRNARNYAKSSHSTKGDRICRGVFFGSCNFSVRPVHGVARPGSALQVRAHFGRGRTMPFAQLDPDQWPVAERHRNTYPGLPQQLVGTAHMLKGIFRDWEGDTALRWTRYNGGVCLDASRWLRRQTPEEGQAENCSVKLQADDGSCFD